MMAAAGCREVSIGIESGDPAVLELLCRKGSHEDGLAAIHNAAQAGLRTRALMMIGCPGTTNETLTHDLRFLRRAEFDAVAITVFTPLPGSDVWKHPAKYGCRIRDQVAPHGVCLYGPDGLRQIEPTIEVEGLSVDELRAQMRHTVEVAMDKGALNRG